ncbi:MAG: hypothetical protein CFE49_12850 [Pseudomonas sp. PGPPP3]|nr:MAG: hypothetical protein CFE49_12850 [Pseudomonas sp. PGPPP3]
MDRRYLIFVSSTFNDLQDERRKVMEQILNMGHLPVGMELFQASNTDQWSYISRRIEECDYYVLIVGERYGSEALEGISYTEKEFDLAVELGIPVSAHLISDAAREELSRSKVEFGKEEKVNSFRAKCKANRIVKYWSNADELANNVGQSLHELFKVEPRVGLVRADQGVSPQLANELARLSVENSNLRTKLQDFEAEQGGYSITDMMAALANIELKEYYLKCGLEVGHRGQLSLLDFVMRIYLKYPDGFLFVNMCSFAEEILEVMHVGQGILIEPMQELVKRLSSLGVFHVMSTTGRHDSEIPGQIVVGENGRRILYKVYSPTDILQPMLQSLK